MCTPSVSRSWWFAFGAGVPGGPLWLWASPATGCLWPWSLSLMAVRARVSGLAAFYGPLVGRYRVRAGRWSRSHRVVVRRLCWLASVLLPMLVGAIGLWALSILGSTLIQVGLVPAGGM